MKDTTLAPVAVLAALLFLVGGAAAQAAVTTDITGATSVTTGVSGSTGSSNASVNTSANANANADTNTAADSDTNSDAAGSASGDSSMGSGSDTSASGDSAAGFSLMLGRSDVAQVNGDGTAVVSNALDVNSNNSLKSYTAAAMRDDANLDQVSMDDASLNVSYRQPAKFLGFIHTQLATKVHVDDSGAVTVSYPWYSFLFSKSDKAALQQQLQTEVRTALTANAGTTTDAGTNAALTANASADASASGSLSNQERALILDRVHSVLRTSANGSADANATASS